jgi:hypothetical protein
MSQANAQDNDVPSDPQDPTLANLLSVHRADTLNGVRVALPGQIVSYNSSARTATVQPLVQDAHIDETGARVAQTLPPAANVPVMFLGPARGRISWPVAAGDTCLLLYCSSSIQQWFAQGGVVDPLDDRRHDLSDPIAIVGLVDSRHLPSDPDPTNSVCIHGTTQLGGSTASHPVCQADNLQAALNTFLTALNTYALAIKSIADPGDSATPALTAAITSMQAAAYASSNVTTQ